MINGRPSPPPRGTRARAGSAVFGGTERSAGQFSAVLEPAMTMCPSTSAHRVIVVSQPPPRTSAAPSPRYLCEPRHWGLIEAPNVIRRHAVALLCVTCRSPRIQTKQSLSKSSSTRHRGEHRQGYQPGSPTS